MNRILASDFTSIEELADKISLDINHVGYILVSDLFENISVLDDVKSKLLNLCSLVGNVTSHNKQNTPVWDIKAVDTSSIISTFSEHANEASLHTDSQYSDSPEEHFALYCVAKAKCLGGASFFLSLENIIKDLKKIEKGQQTIEFLQENKYPFIVPDIFKENPSGPPEVSFGYLLKEETIRFRVDAVERALEIDSSLCSEQQIDSFKRLKRIILNSEKILYTHIENNECLFINNQTMLHGRTQFNDTNRHLLRIRFNNK